MRQDGADRDVWWVVPALVAAAESARLTYISRLPDIALVKYVPDDAFYYLILARNFARLGRWTFDGVEPASGFHLLWGSAIAAVYRLAPGIGLHSILVVLGVVQIVCMTAAAWLVGRTAVRLFGRGAWIGVAVVFLSALSLLIGIGMMETALEMLVAAAVVDLLCRTDDAVSRGFAFAFLLGLAGTLARSDFGLLPFGLFAMQWVLWRRGLSSARMVRLAGAVLAGAAAGVAVVAVHTHWISGGWVQASARQKLFWSQTGGFSIAPARRMVFRFFSLVENADGLTATVERAGHVISMAVWALLGLALLLAVLRRSGGAVRGSRTILAAMGLVVAAYLGLYRFDTEIQDWYAGSFEVPLALLVAGTLSGFVTRHRVVAFGLAGAFCITQVALSFHGPWPLQDQLYLGGISLREHPELKPVGAWNAGVISYFGEGGVTNIDGLVNDRVLPYTEAGTLTQYVANRHLRSIMDFNLMFRDNYARRGGYADGSLERCFADEGLGDEALPDNAVRLHHVKPECGATR
jgi:hypothetical protein